MTDGTNKTPLNRPGIAAIVATMLTCLIVGPLLGAVILGGLVTALPQIFESPYLLLPGLGGTGLWSGFVWLTMLVFSYFAGGLQALLFGAALSVYGFMKGVPPWWFAAITAFVLFAITYALVWSELPETALTMLIVYLAPAMLCWLMCKGFWKAT